MCFHTDIDVGETRRKNVESWERSFDVELLMSLLMHSEKGVK
jgi:hypothetical protein